MDELETLLAKFASLPPEARQVVAAVVSGEAVDPDKVNRAKAAVAVARKEVLAARWRRLGDLVASYSAGVEEVERARLSMASGLAILNKLQPDLESAAAELGVPVPRLGAQTESILSLIKTADTRVLAGMVAVLADEVQRGDARQ